MTRLIQMENHARNVSKDSMIKFKASQFFEDTDSSVMSSQPCQKQKPQFRIASTHQSNMSNKHPIITKLERRIYDLLKIKLICDNNTEQRKVASFPCSRSRLQQLARSAGVTYSKISTTEQSSHNVFPVTEVNAAKSA